MVEFWWTHLLTDRPWHSTIKGLVLDCICYPVEASGFFFSELSLQLLHNCKDHFHFYVPVMISAFLGTMFELHHGSLVTILEFFSSFIYLFILLQLSVPHQTVCKKSWMQMLELGDFSREAPAQGWSLAEPLHLHSIRQAQHHTGKAQTMARHHDWLLQERRWEWFLNKGSTSCIIQWKPP